VQVRERHRQDPTQRAQESHCRRQAKQKDLGDKHDLG
jgi:hypothetical protein